MIYDSTSGSPAQRIAATRASEELERRRRLATWVAHEVMPHEASVRAWLSRTGLTREDIDDVIQESYCCLSGLDEIDHIDRPDGYFFQTARNLVARRSLRAKVVPFVPLTGYDFLDDRPDPEHGAGARLALDLALALLETLPERRRAIFRMKRIDGLSQREIADRVGVSENIVEHEVKQGLLDLKRAWDARSTAAAEQLATLPIGRRA